MLSFALALLATTPIDMATRRPVALLLLDPSSRRAVLPKSKVLAFAAPTLNERTDLELVDMEQLGGDAAVFKRCPHSTRIGCWVKETLNVVQSLPASRQPPYLLVLSPLPRPDGKTEIVTMWFELEGSKAILHSKSAIDAEQELYGQAKLRSALIDPADSKSVESALARAIQDGLRDSPHWKTWGALSLELPREASLLVDGRAVAAVSNTSTVARAELVSLEPGPHSLTLVTATGRQKTTVTVLPGQKQRVNLSFAASLRPRSLGSKIAVGAGVLTAVSGVALVVAAAVAPPKQAFGAVCPQGGCPSPGSRAFWRSCQLGDVSESCARRPSGPLVVPLGLSLLATGGLIAAGAWWFESDRDVPWWSIAVGVATGLAVYGVSEIAAGGQPLGRSMP